MIQKHNQKIPLSLAAILFSGFLIRIFLAPWSHGLEYDIHQFLNWTITLIHYPTSQFYHYAQEPDYLPGGLWLLWGVGNLLAVFRGENLDYDTFLLAIKSLATVADIVIGLMLYFVVRKYQGERTALITSAIYIFNPSSIFLAGVWGQLDAVPMAMVLIATWLFLSKGDRWLWGIPLLVWAIMIKPLHVLIVPLLLLMQLRAVLAQQASWISKVRFIIPRIAIAGLTALATASLIGLPFQVGLPGITSQWPLLSRMNYALDVWQYKTIGAANFWMIPIDSLDRWSDVSQKFFGLTTHIWGNIFLITTYAFVLITTWRRWAPKNLVPILFWAMLSASFALYMIPTRMHERYFFPTMVMAILLTGLSRLGKQWGYLAVGVSLALLLNLIAVYWGIQHFPYRLLAIANAVMFVFVLTIPYWRPGSVKFPLDKS